MKRRKSEIGALKLFAFQDIITGVAGVMLFILMLLVVQLAVASAIVSRVPEPTNTDEPETDATFVEIAELQRTLERRQQLYEQNKIKIDWLIQVEGMDMETILPQLRETEARLRSERAGLRTALNTLRHKNQKEVAQNPSQQILQEIDDLQRQIRQVQSEIIEWQDETRVNYQTDSVVENFYLFDVRRTEVFMIRLPIENQQNLIEINRKSSHVEIATAIDSRYKALPRDKQDPGKRIVVLIRPSAAEFGEELVIELKKRGFDVALELLEAKAQLFRSKDRSQDTQDVQQ